MLDFWDIPGVILSQFKGRENRQPKQPLPVMPFDLEAFLTPADKAKIIWYGHSAILMRIADKTVLIDPMMGPDASPPAPSRLARFTEDTLTLLDDFPPIDLLLMSHDHYDHLDFASIEKLKSKTKQFVVGLGVGRHLEAWDIPAAQISELDWWQQFSGESLEITYTPTRHFSGRGISDRMKSMWGGWSIKSSSEKIWFSGDGGYGDHFKEVGQKLGPFDFAFMECGQYNEKWPETHMFPEESVQAALDGGAKVIMPVHWAGFALSSHTWTEPVERFTAACEELKVKVLTPKIGELFSYTDYRSEEWWQRH